MTPDISEKINHPVAKYLTSLGRSPDRLADDQLKIVTKYAKGRRHFKWALPLCLLLAMLSFWTALRAYEYAHELLADFFDARPLDIVSQTLDLTEDDKELARLHINLCLILGAKICFHCVMGFVFLALPCFYMLSARRTDKIIKAFIPNRT